MIRRRYHLWRALPNSQIVLVGRWNVETTDAGVYRRSAFRYDAAYLRAGFRSVDPRTLDDDLGGTEYSGPGLPPVLDELLPGRWETAVLIRYWRGVGGGFRPSNLHDLLSHARNGFAVGALALTEGERPPALDEGWPVARLSELVATARTVDLGDADGAEPAALARLHAGSSVSGARPKALVYDGDTAYLAKFHRQGDPFDHVRVEYACVNLARAAGLDVPAATLSQIDDEEVLLLKRFDVTPDKGRQHMLSANALLKDPQTCLDADFPSYEMLVALVTQYSERVSEDLKQLYRQMLFNRAINNCDDHLRNFAFLAGEDGWTLSPAYDLVPDPALGKDHQLGWAYQTRPPTLDAALPAAKAFRLTPREGRAIIEEVRSAVARWPEVFAQAGVSAQDRALLGRVLPAPASHPGPAPEENGPRP